MAFPTGWTNYWQATPSNPVINLTGFQAYIDLSRLSGLSEVARSDGGDIRFSDANNNQLACDLMPWYNAGTGLLIVSLGTKPTTDTTYRVWAGNPDEVIPATGDTYGQVNTYFTGLVGYYPSGGGSNRCSDANHLTSINGVVPGNIGLTSGLRATSYDGINQYSSGGVASTIPTAVPISLICLARTLQITGNSSPLTLYATASNVDNFLLRFAGGVSQKPVQGEARRNTAVGFANSRTGINTNTFLHAAAVFATTTSRTAYLTGTTSGVNTTSVTPANITRIGIGLGKRAAFATPEYFNGYVTMAQVYRVALPSGWIDYDNRLTNQTTFWGTWSGATIQSSESVLMTGFSNNLTSTQNNLNRQRPINSSSFNTTKTYNILNLSKTFNTTSYNYTNILGGLDVQGGISNVYLTGESRVISSLSPYGLLRSLSILTTDYSNTQSMGATSISKGFASVSASRTEATRLTVGVLTSLVTQLRVVTSSTNTINKSIQINSVVNAKTADIGSVQISKTISSAINALTRSQGAVSKVVSLNITEQTNTRVSGRANLLMNIGAATDILTATLLDIDTSGATQLLGILNSFTRIIGSINLSIPFTVNLLNKTSNDLNIQLSKNLGVGDLTKTSSSVNLIKDNGVAGIETAVTLVTNRVNKNSGLGSTVFVDTSIQNQIVKSMLFNAYLAVRTSSTLILDEEGEILLSGIISTLSSMGGTVRVSVPLQAYSHSYSSSVTDADLARAIQGHLTAKSGAIGSLVKVVGFTSNSNSFGVISGTLTIDANLEIDLEGALRAISSMNGSLVLASDLITGNLFPVTVYITTAVDFTHEIYRNINVNLTAGI